MRDALDLEHSTSNSTALALWHRALEQYLASASTTMATLEQVLEADPELPMAILFRAYLLKLAADPKFKHPIASCFDALKDRDLNDREQMHLRALALWQDDRLEETAQALDAITNEYPKDILALRVAHYLYFYGEGGTAMLNSLADAIAFWSPSDPFFGYLKGMQAFAFEESGDYVNAEASGRIALEIGSHDIWAAHAVTHVYQMQQRFPEGLSFIESLSDNWTGANNFVNHMHWHKALLFIGLGQADAALAIYDDDLIAPLKDDFYLDLCNAASLLWRLELLGVDTDSRWEALVECSKRRVTDDELVFSTLHYLMVLARTGERESMSSGLKHFEQWSRENGHQGGVAKAAGLPAAKAICQLAEGHYAKGASALQQLMPELHRIGGSHAQRALFSELAAHFERASEK